MLKLTLLLSFLLQMIPYLNGQVTFPDLAAGEFGSDQELVNGILFSNQYGGIDGHPYFYDGKFKNGSVCINNQRNEQVMLRYNLYSQKVEIDYQTLTGNHYLFISVAEHILSFSLEGNEFRYMQFPNENPGYFQVVTSGKDSCFIGWKKEIQFPHDGSTKYQFSAPEILYRIKLDPLLVSFFNKRTFIKTFPAHKRKEVSKLLKKQGFDFKQPTIQEVETIMKAAIPLYEKDIKQ